MNRIRNIVFDMGNVMIHFDPETFISRENVTDPEDRRLILNELFQSVEWAQMDSGILTEETAEPLIMKRIPDRLQPVVRNLLYNWAIPRAEIEGMPELVAALKKAGYGIYHLFTDRFALDPEECMFIDDAPANVAAAIACGWHGIVFHGNADELAQKLHNAGVVF